MKRLKEYDGPLGPTGEAELVAQAINDEKAYHLLMAMPRIEADKIWTKVSLLVDIL